MFTSLTIHHCLHGLPSQPSVNIVKSIHYIHTIHWKYHLQNESIQFHLVIIVSTTTTKQSKTSSKKTANLCEVPLLNLWNLNHRRSYNNQQKAYCLRTKRFTLWPTSQVYLRFCPRDIQSTIIILSWPVLFKIIPKCASLYYPWYEYWKCQSSPEYWMPV